MVVSTVCVGGPDLTKSRTDADSDIAPSLGMGTVYVSVASFSHHLDALHEVADERLPLPNAHPRLAGPLLLRPLHVAYSPGNALGQQVGKGAVDRRVRLAENERQFRRIDEGRPAEGVEQLSFR